MKLRKLEEKDATFMLEWMHDPDVVKDLAKDFSSMQIENCLAFIANSWEDEENLNLAIVNEEDEYMGTVSLKEIDRENDKAEFAITIRKCAMGKGYSAYAMQEIIRIAKEEENLDQVYWCVAEENKRAVRFYDKNGYQRINYEALQIKTEYSQQQLAHFIWYLA
jgi:diamine N-acetyltransferase